VKRNYCCLLLVLCCGLRVALRFCLQFLSGFLDHLLELAQGVPLVQLAVSSDVPLADEDVGKGPLAGDLLEFRHDEAAIPSRKQVDVEKLDLDPERIRESSEEFLRLAVVGSVTPGKDHDVVGIYFASNKGLRQFSRRHSVNGRFRSIRVVNAPDHKERQQQQQTLSEK